MSTWLLGLKLQPNNSAQGFSLAGSLETSSLINANSSLGRSIASQLKDQLNQWVINPDIQNQTKFKEHFQTFVDVLVDLNIFSNRTLHSGHEFRETLQ